MSHSATRRHWLRVCLSSAAVIGLGAGCSGPGSSGHPTTEPSSRQASSAVATHGAQQGARGALSGFVCKADAQGRWSARGTLTNSGSAEDTFALRISVAGKSSRVLAQATREVTVPGKGSVAVTIDEIGKASGKDLTCVVHVTRPA
jgi:hypothetical protein